MEARTSTHARKRLWDTRSGKPLKPQRSSSEGKGYGINEEETAAKRQLWPQHVDLPAGCEECQKTSDDKNLSDPSVSVCICFTKRHGVLSSTCDGTRWDVMVQSFSLKQGTGQSQFSRAPHKQAKALLDPHRCPNAPPDFCCFCLPWVLMPDGILHQDCLISASRERRQAAFQLPQISPPQS